MAGRGSLSQAAGEWHAEGGHVIGGDKIGSGADRLRMQGLTAGSAPCIGTSNSRRGAAAKRYHESPGNPWRPPQQERRAVKRQSILPHGAIGTHEVATGTNEQHQ